MSRIFSRIQILRFYGLRAFRNILERKIIPLSLCGIGFWGFIHNKVYSFAKSIPVVHALSSGVLNPEHIVQMTLNGLLKVQTCYGSSTGFLIDSNGFIVTHHLILQNEAFADVTFQDGTTSQASVLAVDESKGLALLKVSKVPKQIRPLPLELESKNIHVGEEIFSIGFDSHKQPCVTRGVVSGIRQGIGFPMDPEFLYIQTDAPCHDLKMLECKFSSSAFVLVNSFGKIIAVNPMKYKQYRFGLSVDHVQEFYNRAKNNLGKLSNADKNSHAYLRNVGSLYPTCRYHGLQAVSLSSAIRRALTEMDADFESLLKGVYIVNVLDGSRAHRDGIQSDDIIVSANQILVEDFESLSKIVNENEKIKLGVVRRGKDGQYSNFNEIVVDFS